MAVEVRKLSDGRTDIGAIVSFTGLCRDEGGTLAALELEHYPGMAQAEIRRIAEQAITRWPALWRFDHSSLRPYQARRKHRSRCHSIVA